MPIVIPIAVPIAAAVAVTGLKGRTRTRNRGRHAQAPCWIRELARLHAYYAAGGMEQEAVARMAKLETRLRHQHRKTATR